MIEGFRGNGAQFDGLVDGWAKTNCPTNDFPLGCAPLERAAIKKDSGTQKGPHQIATRYTNMHP